MIEKIVLDFLNDNLDVPCWMELPEKTTLPEEYVLIEKTSSRPGDHIRTSTLAVQSYAPSLERAALLNERIKPVMSGIVELDDICRVDLASDYDFTDRTKKRYRYQAVYDLIHYE